MKQLIEILEALFIPKPNDYLRKDSENYGRGLIFIPVPERSNLEKRMDEAKRR
ncbi:MAG TPA: hypothetical protein VMI12_12855 [Puia sp.]|nr:hypothetical protein [Puia sp.]